MALAWVLRDPRVTSALDRRVAASRSSRTNVAALERLDFTADELAEIDRYATESGINIWSARARPERLGPAGSRWLPPAASGYISPIRVTLRRPCQEYLRGARGVRVRLAAARPSMLRRPGATSGRRRLALPLVPLREVKHPFTHWSITALRPDPARKRLSTRHRRPWVRLLSRHRDPVQGDRRTGESHARGRSAVRGLVDVPLDGRRCHRATQRLARCRPGGVRPRRRARD